MNTGMTYPAYALHNCNKMNVNIYMDMIIPDMSMIIPDMGMIMHHTDVH